MKNPDTPKKKKNINESRQSLVQEQAHQPSGIMAHMFAGPIPPPQVLAEYNRVVPGLADRIISLTETEMAHRHKIEESTLNANIQELNHTRNNTAKEIRLGQILAFVIGTITIISGTYAAIQGAQIAGSLIGTGGVVGLVSAFIYGRKSQRAK